MPKNVIDPVKALGAAVIIHAMRQAQAGDLDAAAWLVVDGPLWLDGLGIEITPQAIQARIEDKRPLTIKAGELKPA